MALAIAFDDAKRHQVREETPSRGGGLVNTRFFGSRSSDYPHATLSQWDPGRVSDAHFHKRDQFQVILQGKGTLGRHDLVPYCVHFARAYTPYGPLVADACTGWVFFAMRAHTDPGSQRLPEQREQLKSISDRQPWQITRPVTFATPSSVMTSDTLLQAVPDIEDENGLAVYKLTMRPGATAIAPDPSHGEGQYLAVLKGSLLHDDREYGVWALVFIYPHESPFQVHAGAQGLQALVLNFPQVRTRTAELETTRGLTGFKKWQCALCAFTYDEELGMPEEGIPPGTRWQDVPNTWSCPDCSASKNEFQMVEL